MKDYIIFSGMRCKPSELIKDGDFKLRVDFPTHPDEPKISRYEFFPSKEERDKKYNVLMQQLKDIEENY